MTYVNIGKHDHVPGQTVRAQVAYSGSPAALSTARFIIESKIRNCRLLLTDYRRARDRAQSEHAAVLGAICRRLLFVERQIPTATTTQNIFQLEARAGKAYWQAVSLLCRREDLWQRIYPHATDQLNILLNTGYTQLVCRMNQILVATRLLPEIGVLHGANSREPMVHDIVECFRQVAVDKIIIPIFSRKKLLGSALNDHDMRRGFAHLASQWEKRFIYHGRCEQLQRIADLETVALRRAIIANEPWQPYQHRWGHSWDCE